MTRRRSRGKGKTGGNKPGIDINVEVGNVGSGDGGDVQGGGVKISAQGQGGAPKGNPKRVNGRKSLGKTVGYFKCTKAECGKTWSSVHAWASSRYNCEICKGKAKITNFLDEMCILDRYNCEPCDISWQSIHDNGKTTEQDCKNCGEMVLKDEGTQVRYGTHYWYKCNGKCGIEWEDFYDGKQRYSQRCTKCFNAGEMITIKEIVVEDPNEKSGHGGQRAYFGGGGGHNVEGCDMCQTLIFQGVARSCRRKKLVVFQVLYDSDGQPVDKVVATR